MAYKNNAVLAKQVCRVNGCKTSYFRRRLQKLLVWDIAEEPIKIARGEKNPDCCLKVMDYGQLGGSLGVFDGIVVIGMIIRVNDKGSQKIFDKFKRIIKHKDIGVSVYGLCGGVMVFARDETILG